MSLSSFSTTARAGAVALLVLGAVALQASGDHGRGGQGKGHQGKGHQPRGELHSAPVPVKFDPKLVAVPRKAPVTHKPFQLPAPKMGEKAITPDTQVKLRNGKTVTAEEVLKELNKIEKMLNDLGHSLRDDPKTNLVVKTRIDEKARAEKAKAITARHVTPKKAGAAAPTAAQLLARAKAASAKAATPAHKAAVKKLAGKPMVKVAPGSQGRKGSTVKKWDLRLGRRNIIAAFLEGKLEVKGDKDSMDLLGDAAAGGYLVNHRIEVLKANGSIHAGTTSRANLKVALAGRTLVNVSKQGKTEWHKSDGFRKTFDKSVSYRFVVAVIPIQVRLGVHGSVGVRYFVGVQPTHASLQVVPAVNADVYAQASVDVLVAGAGVEGRLKLLDLTLTFGAELTLGHDNGGVFLAEHVYADSRLKMLSGRISLFAEVTLPDVDLNPFHFHIGVKRKRIAQKDLWNWRGLNTHGHLFHPIHGKQYLLRASKG